MHDPVRDGSHHAYNTCGDQYNGQMDPIWCFENPRSWTLSRRPAEKIVVSQHDLVYGAMI